MRSEQGQTLVEFALILPILLLLVIGIFDFGQALNRKNSLNFLANTAARYAEVNSCAPCGAGQKIDDYVESTAVPLNPPTTIRFCLPTGSSGAVGDALEATASAPFNWLGGVDLPGLPTGSILGGLKSSVTVRILQAANPPVASGTSALYTLSTYDALNKECVAP